VLTPSSANSLRFRLWFDDGLAQKDQAMKNSYMKTKPDVAVRLIDDVLSDAEKISLFKRVQKKDFTDFLCDECKLNTLDAQECMINLYVAVMNKPASQFHKGVPRSEGQWVRFFQSMARFETYHVSRERKRAPIFSLDEAVSDDEVHATTNLDNVSNSAWGELYDQTEVRDLWECAGRIVDVECAEQGCGSRAAHAVRLNLLFEAKPGECAKELNSTANAVSQNLFRIRPGVIRSERMRRFKKELTRAY